jgi:hypothetical protein
MACQRRRTRTICVRFIRSASIVARPIGVTPMIAVTSGDTTPIIDKRTWSWPCERMVRLAGLQTPTL